MKFNKILPTVWLMMRWYSSFAQLQTNNKTKEEITQTLLCPNFSAKTAFKDILLNTKNWLWQTDTLKWLEIFKRLFLEEINKQRGLRDLPPLKIAPNLQISSKKFAEYMKQQQKRGHTVNGKTLQDMWVNLDEYLVLLENVAKNSPRSSAEDIIQWWLYLDQIQDSVMQIKRKIPTHDNAILNKNIDYIGYDITIDENAYLYIVMQTGTKDPQKREKYKTIISTK